MSNWNWENNNPELKPDCGENETPRKMWWLSSHKAGRGLKICQGCSNANKGFMYCSFHCASYQTIIGEAIESKKKGEMKMLDNPVYPNLELIEYQFRQALGKSEDWKNKVDEMRKKSEFPQFLQPSFDVIVFSQIWGSTCTAFDVCEDGTASIGGQAITRTYTVVIKETLTETYGIFVGGKPCYMVDNPNDEFYKDLSERNMKSLSQAKKFY